MALLKFFQDYGGASRSNLHSIAHEPETTVCIKNAIKPLAMVDVPKGDYTLHALCKLFAQPLVPIEKVRYSRFRKIVLLFPASVEGRAMDVAWNGTYAAALRKEESVATFYAMLGRHLVSGMPCFAGLEIQIHGLTSCSRSGNEIGVLKCADFSLMPVARSLLEEWNADDTVMLETHAELDVLRRLRVMELRRVLRGGGRDARVIWCCSSPDRAGEYAYVELSQAYSAAGARFGVDICPLVVYTEIDTSSSAPAIAEKPKVFAVALALCVFLRDLATAHCQREYELAEVCTRVAGLLRSDYGRGAVKVGDAETVDVDENGVAQLVNGVVGTPMPASVDLPVCVVRARMWMRLVLSAGP